MIFAFGFSYNNIGYNVIVKLFDQKEKHEQVSLLKLIFVDRQNINRILEVEANSIGFVNTDIKLIRKFFRINYISGCVDITQGLYNALGKRIPDYLDDTHEARMAIARALYYDDPEEANKLYCIGLKRNALRNDGVNGRRSKKNEAKAKMLRPKLFNIFKEDKTISFCFSANKKDEQTDEEIIYRFNNR